MELGIKAFHDRKLVINPSQAAYILGTGGLGGILYGICTRSIAEEYSESIA